jgi:hypothetical protein
MARRFTFGAGRNDFWDNTTIDSMRQDGYLRSSHSDQISHEQNHTSIQSIQK